MADDVHIYGLDAAKNQIATMSTEQILAAIQRAIETGEVTDEFKAFIEMIKEQNKGIGVKFWLGSQDELNALEKTESNTIYFVYTTVIKDISDGIQKLYDGLRDGTIVVKTATDANNVTLKINGKNISDIFESDGVTAKKATNAARATSDGNGLNIAENYLLKKNGIKMVQSQEEGLYREITVGTDNYIEIGDVPAEKTLSDVIGVSFYHTSGAIEYMSFGCAASSLCLLGGGHTITQGSVTPRQYFGTAEVNVDISGGKVKFQINGIRKTTFDLQNNTFSSETVAIGAKTNIQRVRVYFK